jgi:UDP-N-acetylmuramate--alanine ligase
LCSPEGKGPKVFDDYAHNPEKIAAAIQAVQPEKGKLIALWRPHGFAPLIQNFASFVDAFAENLRPQDTAYILPVFYAGGTAPKGVDSRDFVEALVSRGVNAQALEAYPSEIELETEDVLLVMGARDPQLPVFANRMGSYHRSAIAL